MHVCIFVCMSSGRSVALSWMLSRHRFKQVDDATTGLQVQLVIQAARLFQESCRAQCHSGVLIFVDLRAAFDQVGG